jgi:hypothetical protein
MPILAALVRSCVLALSGALLAPALAFGADGEQTALNLQDETAKDTAHRRR